jgi:HEAT repeat protein
MTDAEEMSALLDDMRSGDENRLISASMMLPQFGKEAVPGLLTTLASSQSLLRDYSAMALGLIGHDAENAVPALCGTTFDADHKVRYAALVAIGKIGKSMPEVVSCLNIALRDPDEMCRKGARNAISELKTPTVT